MNTGEDTPSSLPARQGNGARRLYFLYDAEGRLASLHLGLASAGIEAAQRVARYRYDGAGQLIAVYDALGHRRGPHRRHRQAARPSRVQLRSR